IAKCSYPIDVHNPTGRGTVLRRLPPGESFDIPLRSLLPKDVEDILVAGRCISGTHEAHSSYRVMPTAMATGQGAGVCAAIAAKNNISTKKVDIKAVQAELVKQSANIGT